MNDAVSIDRLWSGSASPAAGRTGHSRWRWIIMPAVCAGVLLVALWWSKLLTDDTLHWPGQAMRVAEVWTPPAGQEDTPPPPTAVWQAVSLPDNWMVSRPHGPGTVWYRIRFEAATAQVPAILIPRLASSGQVYLNGSQLWEGRSRSAHTTYSWNAPLLVVLPTGLLRPQANELAVQVAGLPRYRAGLSQVQLAGYAELRPIYKWRLFWQHDGAMLSSAVSVVAGVVMLLTWLRNRRDTMFLYFGLATWVWGARNSNLFLDELPVPVDVWAMLVHGGHCWFAALFGLFVLRFTGTRWRPLEWALWAYAGLNTLLMLGGGITSIEQVMRWTSAPGFALYFLLVGLLLRKGWRDRTTESALMAATTMTFLVLTFRDALLLSSKLPYDAYYISHYTGVLMLVSIVWGLVARLVRALHDVEHLNTSLEHRVAERTAELETANAAKSRFLAAASHDLRQPVVTIGLLVGMVKERLESVPLRSMMDRVDEAVASMEALLSGLLDISRLDSGTVQPRFQAVRLQLLFDAIDKHEQETARGKGVRLNFRPTPLAVWSDVVLLDQILRNLVGNALRYTERGRVLVAVRPLGRARLRLQVWDTGCGIAPPQQAAVWEEFVQLDNPARERLRGLGLGLAIVKRCAALLGHRLRLRSIPGRGSCFSIELPLAVAPANEPTPNVGSAQSLAGRSIVLVEDDAPVRRAIEARLEGWGARVTPLESLATLDGWLRDADPRPDLLITDHRLPDGSGLQVIERVRRHYPGLPVMVITGDTSPEDLSLLSLSGVPVLHKPFRGEALLELIEQTLAAVAPASPLEGGARGA